MYIIKIIINEITIVCIVFGTSTNNDIRNANSSQRRFQRYKLNERVIKKCKIVLKKNNNKVLKIMYWPIKKYMQLY